MELMLFIVFMLITLIIIFLSFYNTEHAELGIVGFLFLFLLSLIMMTGDIQYKTGENTTYTYECLDPCQIGNLTPFMTATTTADTYTDFSAGGPISHTVGYYLAVASIVGFIGVIVGLKYQFRKREED
jgi:hypothetical protein